MKSQVQRKLKDDCKCKVVGGTHAGKSGIVRDAKTSKTGHVTITVVQATGERFKTLARNVVAVGKFCSNEERCGWSVGCELSLVHNALSSSKTLENNELNRLRSWNVRTRIVLCH
jgi:hypothetical protein